MECRLGVSPKNKETILKCLCLLVNYTVPIFYRDKDWEEAFDFNGKLDFVESCVRKKGMSSQIDISVSFT